MIGRHRIVWLHWLGLVVAVAGCSPGGTPGGDGTRAPDAATVDAEAARDGDGETDATGPPSELATSCASASPPEDGGRWRVLCDGERIGQMLSVWGSGPDDVYIVGGRSRTTGRPGETQVFHWDGSQLEALDVPGDDRAWWVFGTDSEHVWIVGENGLGLRRTEGGDFERFETGTDRTIFGAWGPSPDRLYFVTGSFRDPNARGRVHVLTPDGARTLNNPVLDSFEGRALFKVWGTGPRDVYVVGAKGAVFHRGPEGWSRMNSPMDRGPLLTVSGRPDGRVYAVGGAARPRALRYDGDGWKDVSPPESSPRLMGVHTAAGETVLVSGAQGYLATLSGEGFEQHGPFTRFPLHAVWQDGEGGAWAVGGNIFRDATRARGAILRRPPSPPCPDDGIEKPGLHHLDLQGRGGEKRPDGTYPMFDVERGTTHPKLTHGEHWMVGKGSFTEFTIPLCADITDEVGFRLPNNNVKNTSVRALHELFVVRDGHQMRVARAVDTLPGNNGYVPFDRSSLSDEQERRIANTDLDSPESKTAHGWKDFASAKDFENAPRDIRARPGDTLLYRVTNLLDNKYGLMVWYPQKSLDYQSFIEVRVPEVPGGAPPDQPDPPPEPGPCADPEAGSIEIGRDDGGFAPVPPGKVEVARGPQGSLMFRLAVRGKGFDPGSPDDPTDPKNPLLRIRLALNGPPDKGGRLVGDGTWRRGFSTEGDYHVLSGLQPTVPTGAAEHSELVGATIYARAVLVDATDGTTLCHRTTFTAN